MRTSRAVALLFISSLLLSFAATSTAGATSGWPRADWSVSVGSASLLLGAGSSVTVHVANAGPDTVPGNLALAVPSALAVAGGCGAPVVNLGGYDVVLCALSVPSGSSVDKTFTLAYVGPGGGSIIAAALPGTTIGLTTLYSLTDPDVSNNVAYGAITATAPALPNNGGGNGGGGGSGGNGGGGGNGGSGGGSTGTAGFVVTIASNPIVAAHPGEVQVTVKNVGNAASSDATLALSAGGGSAFTGGDGCSPSGATAVCGLGAILAGDARVVNAHVLAGSDNFVFSAAATATGANPGSASATIPVTHAGTPSVHAAMIGPSTLQAGEVGRYTLRLTNTGDGPAVGLSVDVVATGGTLVDGGACTAGAPGHLTCTTTQLDPGQITEHLIRASAPTVGTLTLRGTPSTGEAGSATTTITAASTDLSFATFGASNANPHVGDSITITLAIANLGTVDVNDAYLDSSVPSGWALGDQSRGPCVLSGGNIHCAFGHIGAGETLTQTMNMVADKVGTISATGTAGSSVPDNNSANNARTLTITVSA